MYFGRNYRGYGMAPGIAMPRLTRAVKALLVATVATFAVQILSWRLVGHAFDRLFGISPLLWHGCIWQVFTYMFLHHSSLGHILFNMLGLYFLGPEVERVIGYRRFFILYFLSGVAGGIFWAIGNYGQNAICVGASGAVLGTVLAFGMLFPNRQITLLLFFVLPVTITGRILAVAVALMAVVPILIDSPTQVAEAAHLGGVLVSYFYIRTLTASRTDAWSSRVRRQNSAVLEGLIAWLKRRQLNLSRTNVSSKPSQSDVDLVLEKLAESGWAALTKKDRDILDRASKRSDP